MTFKVGDIVESNVDISFKYGYRRIKITEINGQKFKGNILVVKNIKNSAHKRYVANGFWSFALFRNYTLYKPKISKYEI